MASLLNKTPLFKIVNESFGIKGKSIKMINFRDVEGVKKISSILRSKDGLKILNEYCGANPDDEAAFAIREEVTKFEMNYGDGTSLLTLFLTYISNLSREDLNKKSIIKEIDTILENIEEQKIEITPENELDIKSRWVKTVCKEDHISEAIIEFMKENPKANVSRPKAINNPNEPRELIFIPKTGYFVNCYANRRYVSSSYFGYKNARTILIDNELTVSEFKTIEEAAKASNKRQLVLCRAYSNDVDVLINETTTKNIMVIRYGSSEETESAVKQDLRFMFDLNDVAGGGMATGIVDEVQVNEDGAFFLNCRKTQDQLEKYANDLRKEFLGDNNEMTSLNYRINNIMSNNTFNVIINSSIFARENVMKDMFEDVFKSLPHYKNGVIKGGMSYISTHSSSGGTLHKIAREIKEKLSPARTTKDMLEPVDLLENTKAIFRIIRDFAIELCDTYETPIMSNRVRR